MNAARRRVMTVVGARPQFVKAAVVSRALRRSELIEEILVHTGQHFDPAMSEIFFRELEIPEPKYNLGVGAEAPATQLARLIERVAPVIEAEAPDTVLLYGDTNSTLAAAIAAAHRDIPVIHVEAGERVYRRRQVPEEANRVLTDNLATLNLTATRRAADHLSREGMAPGRVRFVGDPLYDLFLWAGERIQTLATVTPAALGLAPGEYHLATIHRAQNTAERAVLLGLLEALDASDLPVVLPLHPRVRRLLEEWAWRPSSNLRLIDPLGYFDFMRLLRDCRCCFTDSGGVTREAFFARRPSVIPMDNSWWADVVESGWAVNCGIDKAGILEKLDHMTAPEIYPEGIFGDGHASEKIALEIEGLLDRANREGSWHRHGSHTDLPSAAKTDFSYPTYRRMLERLIEAGYAFTGFGQATKDCALRIADCGLENNAECGMRNAELLENAATPHPIVLLRHDIDCEIERALPLARIEAGLGVRSTFFLMIRADLYNIFSESASAAVRQILALGHRLGLHFDMAAYPELDNPADIAQAVWREASILADWFQRPVAAVSFHRPNALALAGDPGLTAPLPHTYMTRFTREMQYFSDSQGRWKHGAPLDSAAFHARRPLQILVHPVWWNETPVAPYEALLRLIDGKHEAAERALARNNGVYRIGWLKDA